MRHLCPVLILAACATATAQTGRHLHLVHPPLPGQSTRIDLTYPLNGHYALFAIMATAPAMSGTAPFSMPGWTVLGDALINPQTAFPVRVGQLNTSGTLQHTINVPNNPALAGYTIDFQSVDWSVSQIRFSENEVVAALQAQNWQTPAAVSSTARSEQPVLHVLPQGGAIVVWIEGNAQVAASRFSPGVGWSAPILGAPGSAPYNLDADVDATGNLIAVWQDVDDIWTSRLPAGGVWTTPALLENGPGYAGNPEVAMDATGNAIAVWWQHDQIWNNGPLSVVAAHYSPGAGWTQPSAIENDNQGYGEPPCIAMNAAGDATVVWRHSYQQGGNWYSTVMSNRFTSGTGWGGAAPATSDDNISGNTPPEVAVDASGNAVAIWEAYVTGNSFREMHAATWNGSTWSATARLDPVGSNASDTPKVVMTGGGNAIAVWAELDGVFKIMTSTLQNGAWSPATIAAAPPGTAARYPRFAVDGNGRITVLYMHGNLGGYPSGFMTQYLPGTGWLTPYLIDDNNHNGYRGGSIGVDGAGNVIVAMQESWTGNDNKIVVREFR